MSDHAEAHRRIADLVDVLEADLDVGVRDSEINGPSHASLDVTLPERPIVHEEDVEAEKRLEEVQEERDELQDRVDDLEAQIDEDEVERLKDELASARETLAERNEQLDEARRQANEAEQRVEELEARLEGDEENADDPEAEQEDAEEFGGPEERRGFILDVLEDRGVVPGPELRDRVDVSKGALSKDLAALEAAGEIDVRHDPGEARRKLYSIADAGQDDVEEDESDPEEPAPDLPADLDDPPRALAEAMAELGESRVDELADHLDVSKGTVHGRLSALRDHDLVDARAAPDSGRAKLYSLATDAGEEEDTVYVATGNGSGEDKRYHEDEECRTIAQANNVRETSRGSLPHHAPCGTCAIEDEVLVCGNGGTTYHRSEECPTIPSAKNVYPKDLEVIEGYHPCGQCAAEEFDEDDEPDPADVEIPDECDWLELPADVIVEDSSVERTLEEVLRVVERADGWLQVHKRLAASSTTRTKDLLWELGLRDQSGALLDDEQLEERLVALWEHYVDGEPVAADGGGEA